MKTIFDELQYIMNTFDFAKVQSYMIINGWKYKGAETSPSIEELKETANMLLNQAAFSDNKIHWCGTGGFYVIKYDDMIQLLFNIENKTGTI